MGAIIRRRNRYRKDQDGVYYADIIVGLGRIGDRLQSRNRTVNISVDSEPQWAALQMAIISETEEVQSTSFEYLGRVPCNETRTFSIHHQPICPADASSLSGSSPW